MVKLKSNRFGKLGFDALDTALCGKQCFDALFYELNFFVKSNIMNHFSTQYLVRAND